MAKLFTIAKIRSIRRVVATWAMKSKRCSGQNCSARTLRILEIRASRSPETNISNRLYAPNLRAAGGGSRGQSCYR
jgi:hypothetical protein